jgi:hypothetical protein
MRTSTSHDESAEFAARLVNALAHLGNVETTVDARSVALDWDHAFAQTPEYVRVDF